MKKPRDGPDRDLGIHGLAVRLGERPDDRDRRLEPGSYSAERLKLAGFGIAGLSTFEEILDQDAVGPSILRDDLRGVE